MHEIELRAKTLEEARKAAAFQLGVSPEQIEIEVLEEPRGLVAGLLGGTYRVRARIKQEVFAPGSDHEQSIEEEEQFDVSKFTLSGAQEPATPPAEPEPAVDDKEGPPNTQVAENAREFLNGLMKVWGLDAEAQITYAGPDEVHIELVGEDLAVLIGRYGTTLDALQTITAAAANRGVEQGARVILDAENYRERRRESLERLARSTAEKVKKTGREIAIPNLRAHERRVIHLTLRDDPDVETYSQGEGSRRRLIVAPKRRRRRPRRGR